MIFFALVTQQPDMYARIYVFSSSKTNHRLLSLELDRLPQAETVKIWQTPPNLLKSIYMSWLYIFYIACDIFYFRIYYMYKCLVVYTYYKFAHKMEGFTSNFFRLPRCYYYCWHFLYGFESSVRSCHSSSIVKNFIPVTCQFLTNWCEHAKRAKRRGASKWMGRTGWQRWEKE